MSSCWPSRRDTKFNLDSAFSTVGKDSLNITCSKLSSDVGLRPGISSRLCHVVARPCKWQTARASVLSSSGSANCAAYAIRNKKSPYAHAVFFTVLTGVCCWSSCFHRATAGGPLVPCSQRRSGGSLVSLQLLRQRIHLFLKIRIAGFQLVVSTDLRCERVLILVLQLP